MNKSVKMLLALAVAIMPFTGIEFVTSTAKAADNLLVNGGFEAPEVNTAQKWNIYSSGTVGLGWTVEWAGDYGAPEPANLEIHENADATAPEGDQYAELDTDWDGPGQPINNEQANVTISQQVQTCQGAEYELSYQWRPRTANGPHSIDVSWNGDTWSHTSNVTSWNSETVVVTGTGGMDTLSVTETGTPNSFGMYVDDFSLVQVTPCMDMCYAEGEVAEGFQYATTVVGYEQGLKKDGTAVNPGRSIPEQGLAYEAAQSESSFYSLGFDGWIEVSFDNPIFDGPGNDLKLTEDTWGSYPREAADVYVSPDGVIWAFLGTADNTNNVSIHTVSEFDLATLAEGWQWVKFVRIFDATDPGPLPNNADGYDLNAVEALYSGVECAPSISIDKEADLPLPYEVMIGEDVTYTYAVTNDGNVPLMSVVVEDDVCMDPVYVDGDDGNDVLDVDETWNYQCIDTLTETTTNIGTATAVDGEGTEVSNSDSVTVAVKGPECTLTQGYWKNHSVDSNHPDPDWDSMEGETFYLSGDTYLGVLTTAPKGNAYFQLAHQFIAATLNGLDPVMYADWLEAESLFGLNTPEDLEQPKGKKSSEYKELRAQFIELAGILGSYNEGLIGPGHCSE